MRAGHIPNGYALLRVAYTGVLATAGTTTRPELAVPTYGAYQVGIYSTGQWLFRLRPSDIWWSTVDIGQVVGPVCSVYAPLQTGTAVAQLEGCR